MSICVINADCRDAILIEMNPDYCDMARRRIAGDAPLFSEVAAG